MMANRLVDLLFERRGITQNDYFDMEKTVAGELSGMDGVVSALHDIHGRADSRHTITVVPDFDMDGIMAGSLLTAGLAELGFPVEIFIPNASAGYGLDASEADRLLLEHPNTRWVITCDMGISARGGIEHLVSRGVEVIVTDHHMENAATSSRDLVLAIVDPCGIGETYGLSGICGATVAWRVLSAYAAAHAADTGVRDRIERLRALAGIGTVSDLMPLVHDNRYLVRDSVSLLRLVWANPSPWFSDSISGSPLYKGVFKGLSRALSAFDEEHPFGDKNAIDEKFIAFSLAPTFNAAKRMGMDIGHAFNVFLGTDAARDRGMEALMSANRARKELVNGAMETIEEHRVNPCAYAVNVPSGILGLIAAKLSDASGLPCVCVRELPDGSYTGSGRSPEWYPFQTRTCGLGVRAAGHEQAFGVRFASREELERQMDLVAADAVMVAGQLPVDTRPDADVDFVIGGADTADVSFDIPMLAEFIELMDEFRPFGQGWPAPTARMYLDPGEYRMRRMGTELQHLSVSGPNGLRCIMWNAGTLADEIAGTRLSCTGELSLNEFAGTTSVQMIGSVSAC